MLAAAGAGGPASHDYSKMYGGTGSSLSKQPSSTSTAPIDSSAVLAAQAPTFKHLDNSKSFNYNVPGGVGASQAPAAAPGYYMQVLSPLYVHLYGEPHASCSLFLYCSIIILCPSVCVVVSSPVYIHCV